MKPPRLSTLLALILLLTFALTACDRVTAPVRPLGPCNLSNGLQSPLILKDGTCPGFDPKDSTGKR